MKRKTLTLKKFQTEIIKRIKLYQRNKALQAIKKKFFLEINKAKYAYNFFWLGRPIIQIPQDLQAMQEIIWKVKPDLIIETGIAWGGSIIFSASMLTLLEACNKIKNGCVVGIDIEIRPHNKKAILSHPLSKKIIMLEGSSTDKEIISKVAKIVEKKKKIIVFLDSNHTHEHVLAELNAYAPFVSIGSYCIVEDTGIEYLPKKIIKDRPWSKNNNPLTAVKEFLKNNKNFIVDKEIENKLLITSAPGGFLKRIK